MPYCPNCKEARSADLEECPVCKAKLVGELPFQVVEGDNTTWVEIASTGGRDEARLLAGFLEAEGIDAQVEDVKFNMEPVNFGAMGEIRVYVPAEDEQKAQELLRQRETEYQKLDDDEDTLVTDEGQADIDENAPPEPETE